MWLCVNRETKKRKNKRERERAKVTNGVRRGSTRGKQDEAK